MDITTGAVAIMGLKVFGPPTADVLKGSIQRIVFPGSETIGGAVQEWVKRKLERAESTVAGAVELLSEAGLDPQPVPGRLLFPILEHSSVEENDELHTLWRCLLANAASPVQDRSLVLPAYAEILRQLVPSQAAIIQTLLHNGRMKRDDLEKQFGLASHIFARLMTDLVRLQVVSGPILSNEDGETPKLFGNALHSAIISPLGMGFLEACTPPGQPLVVRHESREHVRESLRLNTD